jgi:hypothetical protein
MSSSRFTTFSAAAALLSLVAAKPNNPQSGPHTFEGNPESVCYSYGVDFVDEGHYFINTQSNDNFTSVSTFEGCNQDLAEVLFVDPKGDEVLCSQLPTTPDDTAQLSTCPMKKSDMSSGDYILLLIGNNDNGQPFAWQRGKHHLSNSIHVATANPVVRSLSGLRSSSYYHGHRNRHFQHHHNPNNNCNINLH